MLHFKAAVSAETGYDVASKHHARLLNKLNKSSAIHPGPGGSLAHVDQRRAAAACNITQWRMGPTG